MIPDVIRHLRTAAPESDWRFLFMGGLPPTLTPSRDVTQLPLTTDEARVASYYAASDVYALPSLEDNLPNTISESLTCGTPVVAFPTGGIVEMIQHGRNGALSAERTAASIGEAIRHFFDLDREERDQIVCDAIRTYGPANIADMHISFFTSLLDDPG
jgi:glycosyltransferase involved in cell wall biosynthesis